MTSNDTIPAFILGSSFTALGVLQILGRQQIPTFVLTEPNTAIRASKWFAEFTVDGSRCESPDRLEEFLRSFVIEKAVLLPCSDDYTLAVANLPPDLRTRYPAATPDADTIRILTDKLRLAELMRTLQLPHAESVAVTDVEMVRRLAAEPGRRGFLKPRNSQAFFKQFGVKAFWYDSPDDAVAKFGKAESGGHEMIWQEYVPGPPDRHFYVEGFVDRHGATCALFARRRLRMYPQHFGNSTAMISVPLGEVPGAVDTMTRLLEHFNYRGIFSAEFKDDDSGVSKLLEVNPRAWWYVNVAAQCGVDVVRMAYDDALEYEVATVRSYQTGAAFVYNYLDYHACTEAGMPIATMLRHWSTARPAFYAPDDPQPTLKVAAGWAKDKLCKLFDRK